MSGYTINQLPQKSPLVGDEEVEIQDAGNGSSGKTTVADIAAHKLPTPTALDFVRWDSAGVALENRTPAQVLADISAAPSSHVSNTNNPHQVTAAQTGAIPTTEKGIANGVATLNANGEVAQLPAGAAANPTLFLRGDGTWQNAGGALSMPVKAITAAYSVVAADQGKLIECGGGATYTVTLPSAASVGDGFVVSVHNSDALFPKTLTPNGTDTINGLNASVSLNADESVFLTTDGAGAWYAVAARQPSVLDLSSATTDHQLAVRQKAVINFTSATSIPLHIACGDGQIYRMYILWSDTFLTSARSNTKSLLPNNTTYTGSILHTQLANGAGYQAAIDAFQLGVGWEPVSAYSAEIFTSTNSKSVLSRGFDYQYGAAWYNAIAHDFWNDTTTAWTSLGTVTLVYARSGQIVIERIV